MELKLNPIKYFGRMELNWEICGHSKALESIERDFKKKSLSHSMLLFGPAETGKFTVLKRVAQVIHCPNNGCFSCNTCRLIDDESHIDTFMFKVDGNELGIKEFRELKTYLSLSAQEKYKVVIIQNIERLSIPLQNSMLKILEEPPKDVYFLLSSSNESNVLETIISRCRIYRTGLCSGEEIVEFLARKYADLNIELRSDISFFAAGRAGMAIDLAANPDRLESMQSWKKDIENLEQKASEFEALQFAERLSERERAEIKQFLLVIIQFYRQKMHKTKLVQDKLLIANKIEQCAVTLDLIFKNVNVKIALEVLFLHCFTNLGNIANQ